MAYAHATNVSLGLTAVVMLALWAVSTGNALRMASAFATTVFVAKIAPSMAALTTAVATACATVQRVSATRASRAMTAVSCSAYRGAHAQGMASVSAHTAYVSLPSAGMTAHTRAVPTLTSAMAMDTVMPASVSAMPATAGPRARLKNARTTVVVTLVRVQTACASATRDGVESTALSDCALVAVATVNVFRTKMLHTAPARLGGRVHRVSSFLALPRA